MRARWIGCAVLAASLFGSVADVSAQTDADVALSTMRDEIHGYYQGERISTYVISGFGIAGIGVGIPLVLQESDLARGAGWSLIILGALETIGAVFYAFQVGALIDHYEAALDRDPAAFREEETAHMDGTISRFIIYQITELVLTLGGIGLATAGFVAGEDVWAGIGVGVASLAFPLLVVDFINQRRGRAYAERVRGFAVPRVGVAPSPDGVYFTISTAF